MDCGVLVADGETLLDLQCDDMVILNLVIMVYNRSEGCALPLPVARNKHNACSRVPQYLSTVRQVKVFELGGSPG